MLPSTPAAKKLASLFTAIMVLFFAFVLGAQPDPSFEVVSIRQNKQGVAGGRIQVQNGAFNANAATVRQLIVRAYGVQDFQIVDEPGWVNSDRFDIAARMQSGTAPNQLTLMIRNLLAERFALRSHTETRDLPVYALVLARKDKKLGPHIQPSKVDCDAIAEEAQSRGGAPPPMRPGEKPPCSIGFSARGQMSSRSKPISDLLTFFSQTTQRTVLDRTGLKGGWDIDLSWTPDAAFTPALDDVPQGDPGGPSIFTAVQEQLGLRFESAKAPLPALVIDSISRPTEN